MLSKVLTFIQLHNANALSSCNCFLDVLPLVALG